jgi:hypothetical protein
MHLDFFMRANDIESYNNELDPLLKAEVSVRSPGSSNSVFTRVRSNRSCGFVSVNRWTSVSNGNRSSAIHMASSRK